MAKHATPLHVYGQHNFSEFNNSFLDHISRESNLSSESIEALCKSVAVALNLSDAGPFTQLFALAELLLDAKLLETTHFRIVYEHAKKLELAGLCSFLENMIDEEWRYYLRPYQKFHTAVGRHLYDIVCSEDFNAWNKLVTPEQALRLASHLSCEGEDHSNVVDLRSLTVTQRAANSRWSTIIDLIVACHKLGLEDLRERIFIDLERQVLSSVQA